MLGRFTSISVFVAIAVCAITPQSVFSQASDSTWILSYAYMKSTSPDYVALERDVWKPIHQERRKAGEIWGWGVDAVPQSFDGSYDYVVINVYRTWDSYSTAWDNLADRFAAAHPGKNWEAISAKTRAARTIVKSEVFEIENFIGSPGPVHSHVYMKVAPGGGQAYLKMEDEVYKPMHQAVLDAGNLTGWGIASIVAPGGSEYPYNYLAMNFHDSLAQLMGPGITPAVFEAVHPDADWDEIGEMTMDTRDAVRYEIWYNAVNLND